MFEEKTGTIKGFLTHCITGEETKVNLEWYIRPPTEGYLKDGIWFHLTGGPTGYESFQLTAESVYHIAKRGWLACAGTKGSWDRLFITAEQMKIAFDQLFGE